MADDDSSEERIIPSSTSREIIPYVHPASFIWRTPIIRSELIGSLVELDKITYPVDEDENITVVDYQPVWEDGLPKINASLQNIIEAVADQKEIDGINITQGILEAAADITITDKPELGKKLLLAFSVIAEKTAERTLANAGKIASAKASAVRSKQADEYAIKMYKTVNEVKEQIGKKSFRETIKELTKRNIPTPKGGSNWTIGTLQQLYKRWDDLGLKPDEPTTKTPKP